MIDLAAGRGGLTDVAWERIGPLLPQVDGRGRPWRDHWQVVNGVLWRLRAGLRGGTCLSGMGRGRPSRSGSPAGRRTAGGQGCWSMCRSVTTRWAGSSGLSLSTPRSTGPTSTPPAHVKRGRRRGRTGRSGPLAPRRPAARLRQGRLPRPQRGRTMLRTPQAVPRDRDQVRQARRPLPDRRRPGFADPLAPRYNRCSRRRMGGVGRGEITVK